MAARAVIDGQVTLEGPDFPTTVVDFQRDPSHTVVLTGDQAWNSPNFTGSVMDDIQTWINRVRRADFGGPVNRMTVGAGVLEYMLDDPKEIGRASCRERRYVSVGAIGVRE